MSRRERSKLQEMGIGEACRSYLFVLLRLITAAYLLVVGLMLPLYYRTSTDYTYIANDKVDFFRKFGAAFGRLFLIVLTFWLILQLFTNYKKGRFLKLWETLSLTDKFVCLYIAALLASYACSDYQKEALLGAEGGWQMGLLPQLLLAGSYFAISGLLTKGMVKGFLKGMLAIAFIVFLLGLLNRYGYNPLQMESAGELYISTIGNINWYSGYFSVLFPLGAGLFVWQERPEEKGRKRYLFERVLLGAFVCVGFATGISQGSDSGIAALAALMLFMGCLVWKSVDRIKRFVEMLLLCSGTAVFMTLIQWLRPGKNNYVTEAFGLFVETGLSFLITAIVLVMYVVFQKKGWGASCRNIFKRIWCTVAVVFAVTVVTCVGLLAVNTISLKMTGEGMDLRFFIFDREWASDRGGTWMAGLRIWWEQDFLHIFTGVGPDAMSAYLKDGAGAELQLAVSEQFGIAALTNAHGEWITILANLGVFGLIGFGGMLVSAIVRFGRLMGEKNTAKERKSPHDTIVTSCALALFTYTIHNIFSFEQVMNITQMFIVLGMGECLLRKYKGL